MVTQRIRTKTLKRKHLDMVVEMPKTRQDRVKQVDWRGFRVDQVIAVMDHPVNDIVAFEKRKQESREPPIFAFYGADSEAIYKLHREGFKIPQ